MRPLKDEPTLLAILAIILAVFALWAVGCGSKGTPTNPSGPAASVTVNIVGSSGSGAFSPNPATVTTGNTLGFKNNDGTTHHMVADNGSFDTGDVAPGATSTALTMSGSGALAFHCTIHPSMVGTINRQ